MGALTKFTAVGFQSYADDTTSRLTQFKVQHSLDGYRWDTVQESDSDKVQPLCLIYISFRFFAPGDIVG